MSNKSLIIKKYTKLKKLTWENIGKLFFSENKKINRFFSLTMLLFNTMTYVNYNNKKKPERVTKVNGVLNEQTKWICKILRRNLRLRAQYKHPLLVFHCNSEEYFNFKQSQTRNFPSIFRTVEILTSPIRSTRETGVVI